VEFGFDEEIIARILKSYRAPAGFARKTGRIEIRPAETGEGVGIIRGSAS
jgi:hypothetical protein